MCIGVTYKVKREGSQVVATYDPGKITSQQGLEHEHNHHPSSYSLCHLFMLLSSCWLHLLFLCDSLVHPAGNMVTMWKRDIYSIARNPHKRCQVSSLIEVYDLQQSLCLRMSLISGLVWVNGPWCGNVGKLQFLFKTFIDSVLVSANCVTVAYKLGA